MLVARIGYVLIVLVIATAVAAAAFVLRPDHASHPKLEFQEVINYSHFGVIDHIDVRGQTLTVHFVDSFDAETRFGTSTHTFEAPVPSDQDIIAVLQEAGIAVNKTGGIQVSSH
jgi:hypothetical protein